MASIAELQLDTLQQSYPGSRLERLSDGTLLVSIPDVRLPPGWNQDSTTVRFLVPVGYPVAQPDCFWADSSLRLANNAMPASSGVQQIPQTGLTQLWFSWHVATWNPGRDSLITYARVIRDRLARPQ